jgi:hypothetical protein
VLPEQALEVGAEQLHCEELVVAFFAALAEGGQP